MSKKPRHPGSFVREFVIPKDITVSASAKRIGIGRPALSNFLNGNASLSPELALKLAKAFGADQRALLAMQAEFDLATRANAGVGSTVLSAVPSFVKIMANEIEHWARSNIDARARLPVLLRRLANSTVTNLSRCDFPGYDNAQRKGNDGITATIIGNAWVPAGKAFWEFGVDQDYRAKAESDYAARVVSVHSSDRIMSTFVFVTPRNWPGKIEWEKQKSREGKWKAVRALDASDLEQWIEQSGSTQIWFAEQIGRITTGFETLGEAWHRWAEASAPALARELFQSAVSLHQGSIQKWLEEPPTRPLYISADSREEMLAFLACVFETPEFCLYGDRAVIFTSPELVRKVVATPLPIIPVVHSEAEERELGGQFTKRHCIVFHPRNAVKAEAEITIGSLDYQAFEKALKAMGIDQNHIDRLARQSGRSPTILRRLLSKNAAIRTPVWSSDNTAAGLVLPLTLIGNWHTGSKADTEVIAQLANIDYHQVEKGLTNLLQLDDSPVWATGRYSGVTSKIDALFATAKAATAETLNLFFFVAEYVLSEQDPTLELPEHDRWLADLRGKKREFSSALRQGISESLVVLAVHGNHLFQRNTGVNVEAQMEVLVRKLLKPLSIQNLASQNKDLPNYAEAAPTEFLTIIEEDLSQNDPILLRLLKPVDNSAFGATPSRTGLLWALERLAWNPQTLPRVVRILGRLSQHKIDDNWMNKPFATLQSIFRSWLPQTAADLNQRIKTLEMLVTLFPIVAWELCINEVKPMNSIGHYSARPIWRSDAGTSGHGVNHKERYQFFRKIVDILIGWPNHSGETLGDLMDCLHGAPEEDEKKIWDIVETWAKTAGDKEKGELRERLRCSVLTRRGKNNLSSNVRERARNAYEMLMPSDLIARHEWLFKKQWIDESADELEEEDFDWKKRENRIDRTRREAMHELWSWRGINAIVDMLTITDAPGIIGQYAVGCYPTNEGKIGFVLEVLELSGDLQSKADICLRGFLIYLDNRTCDEILKAALAKLSNEKQLRLLLNAPFRVDTWMTVADLYTDLRTNYWRQVDPIFGIYDDQQLSELIDRLLEVERPRAAFNAVHMCFKDVETTRLKRLIKNVATVGAEPKDFHRLDGYYISEAFNELDTRSGVSVEEKAQLEFLFVSVLDDKKYGIPNLEKQISENPLLFVQALALVFKRDDGKADPEEWTVKDTEKASSIGTAAYHMLHAMRSIPGAGNDNTIDAKKLLQWLHEARRLISENGRTRIGDQKIGELLSKGPAAPSGVWPCVEICQGLEAVASEDVRIGFSIGKRNSRGVVTKSYGDGGAQEFALSQKYCAWADNLRFEYPFTASCLDEIAKAYEREGKWEDTEAQINKRLNY